MRPPSWSPAKRWAVRTSRLSSAGMGPATPKQALVQTRAGNDVYEKVLGELAGDHGGHLHFIDGNNGGYALAATELKAQMKATANLE